MTTTIINDRDNILQASARDVDPRASKYIALAVDTPFFHVNPDGVATPDKINIKATLINISGTVNFSVGAGNLVVSGNSATFAFADMPVDTTTITATVIDRGQTYTATQVISKVLDGKVGKPGDKGDQFATAYLYKWSTSQPALPQGKSTLSWNVGANTSYVGTDGWDFNVPANPGTPSVKLWVAQKSVSATAGTTTTDIIYTTGATVAAYAQNGATGAPGVKSAKATAYLWGIGPAPTSTGTGTYTWATGLYNTPPSGWSQAKPSAPALGYTLYEATVPLVDSSGATTSAIDWTTAGVAAISYMPTNGAQGASATIAYTLIDGNTLNAAPATFEAAGTALPTTGTWGETRAWQTTAPVPAAGQSVFQSNGIYNSATNKTVWGVPYLSALRVGQLSALTVNTGDLNISGTVSSANGNFAVDANGQAVMKAITIKDASGNIILSSGTKLNIDYAPIFSPVVDTRTTNTAPKDYPVGHQKEFKTCTVIGLTTSAQYCTLETIKGWVDGSGGNATQWAYVSSGETWKRSAANNATTWGGWVRDIDTQTYTGDLNATYGASFGQYGNIYGQITAATASTYIASAAITDALIGSLSANKITTGILDSIALRAGYNSSTGTYDFNVGTNGVPNVNQLFASNVSIQSTLTGVPPLTAIGTGGSAFMFRGNLTPDFGNSNYLGNSSANMAGIYSQTAVVVGSDARYKKDVENCELGLDFINSLRPVSYRLIEGEKVVERGDELPGPYQECVPVQYDVKISSLPGVRKHYGFIAQEVKTALGNKDAAIWTLADKDDPESYQALRYEELIAPLAKAVQELSAKVAKLEAQLAAKV